MTGSRNSPIFPPATVVLVHGALVKGWELLPLKYRLRQLGYRVRQFGYSSMWRGLEENSERLRNFLEATPGEIIHVVGHSMGGVLMRRVFEQNPDVRPGRLVAIGSPFLGCWIGRRVGGFHSRAYWLTGKTVRDHVAQPGDPVWRGARELGVLAGTFPFGVGRLFGGLPQPSDGVVLWEETRLGGIADHATYRLNHFGMLASRRCARQVAHFLEHGAFAKDSLPENPPG